MTTLRTPIAGVPAAPGIARGPWVELGRAPLPAPRSIPPEQVSSEIARLQQAVKDAARELRGLADQMRDAGHENESRIFRAHAVMARDPDLVDAAAAEIERDRVDAIGAITAAAGAVAARLAALDDELLRGRATDVLDVGERIARLLAGVTGGPILARPSIVVAEDLAPSVTALLPRDRLLGVALERSSPTAHAVILARAYGIPAVVGVSNLLDAVREAGPEAELAIDGSTGEIVVAPDAVDVERFAGLAADAARARDRDLEEAASAARTADGVDVLLQANIGGPDEVDAAVELGAQGVGLFRTEFLFLERSAPPTEDEQTEAYRRVVEAFPGATVTIRLLDVGGDKPIPYLPVPPEDNPFLGVRALRLAADRPDLFTTQLRACFRAAVAGRVRVMAPMVADAGDVDVLLALAERARESLAADGQPFGPAELGVMLEIPSAVLTAATYFDRVAFASIGTNDLLQYTLAADRGNPSLERYRDAMHPALLQLVRHAASAANRANISLSVCGEMAGDAVSALALVGLGVRSLSMSPANLPAVRRAIRSSVAGRLEAAAESACSSRSATEARSHFG